MASSAEKMVSHMRKRRRKGNEGRMKYCKHGWQRYLREKFEKQMFFLCFT